MSDSDSDSNQDVAPAQNGAQHVIKPAKGGPQLDTSTWPLLLKNYDLLNVKTNHFTPLPCGYSPLNRPIDILK
jgi:H/ACA ribonucleoprotein complex subunit 4